MNNQPSKGLVVVGLSAMLSLAAIQTASASDSPNCSDVLAGNITAVSQKMTVLLGEDITKSNLVTTVVPAENNPFVTEALIAVSNDVSPSGSLPSKSLEEINKVRANIEKAGVEVGKLQGTFEVAFVSLIDGHCQFSTNQLTTNAKIDFDHLEGLSKYSIPALLALVDESYRLAELRILAEEARYEDANVLVVVEDFDGSHVTFSVTNLSSNDELEPNFNNYRAFQTEEGELVFQSESFLGLSDPEGIELTTLGIAELNSSGENNSSIVAGETRKFITSIESEVAPETKLSLEFPAKVLNTDEAFTLYFTDSVAMATAGLN